jgi:hypothetical protein
MTDPDDYSGDTALMVCGICGLRGGPFGTAESAHLSAVHDQLHHDAIIPQALQHQH